MADRHATSPAPSGRPEPLPHVGGYSILTKIGEGGMGVVHLAQAPDGTRVALKVLRPHVIGDDEARARLAREVSSLRRVRSPRVAEVIDADPWGATPYVATRYVPGLSLHEHVRQNGPVVGEDLVLLAAGLADAVEAVHRVGVLHRDIKPSNVLLEGRAPVLIDFGLARLAEDPRLTQTGWLLGTPGYLAPEILYGEDPTTASDVHSWAATVVFAAIGRAPFGKGPAMAIMDRVRRGEHDLTGVPPSLQPLLRACLAPNPAERPTTAAVLQQLRPSGPAPVPPAASPEPVTVPLPRSFEPDPSRTRHLTAAAPVQNPHQAAYQSSYQSHRAPYQAPPPPFAPPRRRPVRATARLQRVSLLAALFAAATLGVARAPYVSLAVLGALALLVRTFSWTSDSVRDRQQLRGRRRWFDAPLALVSAPWYLVVATGGTVVLMLWSALLAFVAGFVYLLFRAPALPGLLLMGAVLALAMWWGPGGHRLRAPVRLALVSATRQSWVGWLAVAVVAGTAAVLAFQLLGEGVVWSPAAGAPWRSGTPLGTVLGWV